MSYSVVTFGVVIAGEECFLDSFEEVYADSSFVLNIGAGTLESTMARKMKPYLQKVRN